MMECFSRFYALNTRASAAKGAWKWIRVHFYRKAHNNFKQTVIIRLMCFPSLQQLIADSWQTHTIPTIEYARGGATMENLNEAIIEIDFFVRTHCYRCAFG